MLPLDNAIKTITYDFFKNNGDFICQVILFISAEQDQKESRTSTKMSIDSLEQHIHTLMKPILNDYIADRRHDLELMFLNKFTAQITGLFQSITCVLTTVKPENIKNTRISLPKNCDVFLEDEKVSFTALRSGTDQCYVVTKDKLFHYKKGKPDTIVRQEIKLTQASFSKLKDNLLTLKNGHSLDGFFPQSLESLSLHTVINFLPPQHQPVKLVTNNNSGKSTYTTLVINQGKHVVRIINSQGSFTQIDGHIIKNLQLNDIVQIESQPGLLNIDKQEIETKEKKYELIPAYFKEVKENLCTQAEAMRREAYKYWEAPTAKTWLFLISRLWAFQERLESGELQQPEDPTYELLRKASLTHFWPLTKALQNVQTLEVNAKEISEDDLTEIKKQWQEASTNEQKSLPLTLTWQQAFKNQHRNAPIQIGGEVRALAVMPINHAHKIRNFTAFPIPRVLSTQSKCVEHHFLKGQNIIILSLMPPASQTLSTLDAIREFYCYNAYDPLAKLTVLYSPRYIEEPGWQQDMQDVRDRILKSLAEQIFTNLDKFNSGLTEGLRGFISTVLSRSPFKDVKANLLFCLSLPASTATHRYLIGVGNCMALTFRDNAVDDSNIIKALYDSEKDVPVLLNSLNKPDDPGKLISGSHIRQSESIQIVYISGTEDDILLCSGRLIGPDLLDERSVAVTSKFKFREYYLNLQKLLSENKKEIKEGELINQVTQALQKNRRKFLDIIENPNMISAWKKLEHQLRERNPPLLDNDVSAKIKLEVKNINSCSNVEKFIQLFNFLKLKTDHSLATSLSIEESNMIRNLWQIATLEAKGLSGSQITLTWQQIRARYFIYFEGIKDFMAVFSPDLYFKRFSLSEHINALADQYFLPLQQAGKKEQILEIKAFNHAISSVDNDEKIYGLIYQKLKFIDQQGSLESGFWMDLAKVLIFMFINVDSSIDYRLDPEGFYLSELISALASKIRSCRQPSHLTTAGFLSSSSSYSTRGDSRNDEKYRFRAPLYQQAFDLALSRNKKNEDQQVQTSTLS